MRKPTAVTEEGLHTVGAANGLVSSLVYLCYDMQVLMHSVEFGVLIEDHQCKDVETRGSGSHSSQKRWMRSVTVSVFTGVEQSD